MRVEFYRAEDPGLVIGSAEWDGTRAVLSAGGDEARRNLERVFRVSGVRADGQAVIQPGTLEWFRTAALVRGAAAGYGARFVTDLPGGWDPALDPQSYGWAGSKPELPRER